MSIEQSKAIIMTDLSYGDAGKGTTTEWFAAQADSPVVIRYNGGGQAEHNIVTPDGRHHIFSQFGAASFIPNALTHLSRDMWINPQNMNFEGDHLEALGVNDAWERVSIDQDARIVTPYHRAGNRLRELARGSNRHGSTGQGISEAVMDTIFRDDMTIRVDELGTKSIVSHLEDLRRYKRDQFAALGPLLITDTPDWEALNNTDISMNFADIYADWLRKVRVVARDYLGELALSCSHLLFEPAQGILLDEKRGFHPHTTWSNTTPDNARRQLEDIQFSGDVATYGIVRAYTTRHGFGPFVTEDEQLDEPLHEYYNGTGPWQGKFRIGHFDAVAHRYAANSAGQLDGIVVTGVDRYDKMSQWQYASSYTVPTCPHKGEFFELDGDLATNIRLSQYGDKLHMARLTDLLFDATPVYTTIETPSREQIVHTIEHELGLRIVLASYGPTVNDKQVFKDIV